MSSKEKGERRLRRSEGGAPLISTSFYLLALVSKVPENSDHACERCLMRVLRDLLSF